MVFFYHLPLLYLMRTTYKIYDISFL